MGQHIVIEGKHPEKQDALGLIERHFVRKFQLPKYVSAESITSNLTAEGQLTIFAEPPKPKVRQYQYRSSQFTHFLQ